MVGLSLTESLLKIELPAPVNMLVGAVAGTVMLEGVVGLLAVTTVTEVVVPVETGGGETSEEVGGEPMPVPVTVVSVRMREVKIEKELGVEVDVVFIAGVVEAQAPVSVMVT